VIQRNPIICFNTIFGQIELESPYLWSTGKNSKPLADEMKITHHGRSEAVKRAMSDFGSEESFGQAAKRFEEHYKYDCCASTVSRVTKQIAEEAQEYVEKKLFEAGKSYGEAGEGMGKILIEMDGCELRTGILKLSENSEQTTVHGNPKKEKVINWRDVRMGFAREPDAVSKIYVGKMDKYPEVVGQLFNASVLIGMTPETRVIGIADGGIGLKEELENQFPNMQFILDKAHLRDHLYDTAESLGINEKKRNEWVNQRIDAIGNGEVGRIKNELEKQYEKSGNKRLNRLIGYLGRFYDCMNYNDFRADGYPVGSGEIESTHKFVPQKRLKLPGACWHPDSINPMLALRILRANNWWNEFWEKRIEMKAA
jgi:hypothetical protein